MKTYTPEKLDELTPHQLVAEIKEMAEQYNVEVTSSRRTWPRSIRERVLALGRLGVSRQKIARLCGIPPATVFLWCRAISVRRKQKAAIEPQFLLIAESVTRDSNPTVGITVPPVMSTDSGLRLLLPGGFEVHGLTSVRQVWEFYRAGQK